MLGPRKLLDLGYRAINGPLSGMVRSYRLLWETAALTSSSARDAVLRGSNEEDLQLSGRRDAETLKPFLREDSVALDLGCGIGRVMKYVAPSCAHVYGVDISGGMLRHARHRLRGLANVSFYQNNGRDLHQFGDEMFDLVYSFLTLQHLEKEDAYVYICEAYRVLKPSGRVSLQFADLLSDRVFGWFAGYARRRSRHVGRVRPTTDREVEYLLIRSGFTEVSVSTEGDYIYGHGKKR